MHFALLVKPLQNLKIFCMALPIPSQLKVIICFEPHLMTSMVVGCFYLIRPHIWKWHQHFQPNKNPLDSKGFLHMLIFLCNPHCEVKSVRKGILPHQILWWQPGPWHLVSAGTGAVSGRAQKSEVWSSLWPQQSSFSSLIQIPRIESFT